MLRTARGGEFQSALLVATAFPHALNRPECPMHTRHVHLVRVHQSELLADAHQFGDVGVAGVVAESVFDILHESVVYLVKSLNSSTHRCFAFFSSSKSCINVRIMLVGYRLLPRGSA